ncbi:uncharacterized protein E0L32_000659 [Thyridium curvatum]|uniref:RRM domain-containing protein n=1 Tax=Thyridium curvatum TaxID=1093900 RepID=A0A507ATX1_9PEZI|nr:uncharacterized protein E0L32_000659 [Thyridium curvatum]TPX14265.1 hypothetical protein E0L32_000659 [Thyridium curvatum]
MADSTAPTEPVAEVWSFPTDISEFDHDERISFSRLENKYIAVQDDGTEYEFDTGLRRWIPIIDDDLIEAQQAAYAAAHSAGYDEDDDNRAGGGNSNGRKRKQDGGGNGYDEANGRQRGGKRQQRAPPAPKQNTAIYVTGLPADATVDEVAELFSRKCGVIAEEIDSGRPRVKLYTDAEGNFKGDALIVFFKPQSVEMAIMLLDDTDFRFSPTGQSSGRMKVQAADSSYKKTNYDQGGGEGQGEGAAGGGGDNGGGKGKNGGGARRGDHADKQKIIKKTQKLDAKLADWSDDEPSTIHQESRSSKWDKVVILKHMFTLQELDEDPAALLEIKEDIREECAKLGDVTNVILYDQEEEGVVSVKFKKTEAAEACIRLMDGRNFDGRVVEASLATGKEKYQKSKMNDDHGEDHD